MLCVSERVRNMIESKILKQVAKIEVTNKNKSTHFIIQNKGKIRYIISIQNGKKRLAKNITAYSSKLKIFLVIIDYLPLCLLRVLNIGYFASVSLHPELNDLVDYHKLDSWNIIVGTYDVKQKLVLQCFCVNEDKCIYMKIGNKESDKEMRTEMKFLRESLNYRSFSVPNLLDVKEISQNCPFNILVTEEIHGDRVETKISQSIIQLCQEIAGEISVINGKEYQKSHGDFAPWNIRKSSTGYIVYDWEHYNTRIKGFDLMHFATVIEVMLNGKDSSTAFDLSLKRIRTSIPEFSIEKSTFLDEFNKLRQ